MAYYKGMCEFCRDSSGMFPYSFGWCDNFDKPISKVKHRNRECVSKHIEIDLGTI